jgi:Tol biopolymer transport system component/DNA-binding winged helix-turn-helix (wHTH) protein
MPPRSQRLYEFGPFRLDTAEQLLLRDGKPLTLTPKAFEMLVALVERSGHLVEKEELMKVVWADAFVEESNLTNNVSALRKLLGQGKGGENYIETVPKRGYRFTAAVRELTPEALVIEKHTVTRIVTEDSEEETRSESVALTPESAPVIHQTAFSIISSNRSSRALLLAALIVAGATTAFGIYWLIAQRQARTKAIAAQPFSLMNISRLTTSGRIKHATISRDGKYLAHVTEDADGDSLWVRHVAAPTGVRIAGPAATEYASVTFAPGGDSIYYVTLVRDKGDTALYRVPVLGGPSSMVVYDAYPIDFSPNGNQITFVRAYRSESRLLIANADGTNERTLATRRQPEFFRVDWNAPAWSPDGKTIACQVRLNDQRGQYETVVRVSVEDGSQRPLTTERWSYTGQPVWLADGRGLLVTANESETAPKQVWQIAIQSGKATRVTHDLDDYHDLSLTADSSRLAAVQKHSVSSIWVAPEGDANRAKQIASEVGWIRELAWTPDGRIVFRSNAGGGAEIWVMNANGRNPKQLTMGARACRGLSVSPDGRYIFFSSEREGRFNIWRVDADGSNLKQLTNGDNDFYPHCAPDGQWVVFQREVMEPRLWKVPVEGGEPEQLTKTRACWPHVSPDGELVGYYYLDPDVGKSRWRIGIVSSEGGTPVKQFDLPPTVVPSERFVRWAPDGRSIAYANSPGGLSEIWIQPVDGSRPKQLTNFKAEQIIAFDWSPDGRSLAFVRNVETSDVVLIEQKQK